MFLIHSARTTVTSLQLMMEPSSVENPLLFHHQREKMYSIPYKNVTKASNNIICELRAMSTWLGIKWTSDDQLRHARYTNIIALRSPNSNYNHI